MDFAAALTQLNELYTLKEAGLLQEDDYVKHTSELLDILCRDHLYSFKEKVGLIKDLVGTNKINDLQSKRCGALLAELLLSMRPSTAGSTNGSDIVTSGVVPSQPSQPCPSTETPIINGKQQVPFVLYVLVNIDQTYC